MALKTALETEREQLLARLRQIDHDFMMSAIQSVAPPGFVAAPSYFPC